MMLFNQDRAGSEPVALLRVTLGVIILATWWDNLDKGLYTADDLEGFLDWLASDSGNDGSLGFYHSFLDSVVVPISGVYGAAQAVLELAIGIGLVLGLLTRLSSLVAVIFFANLFLAYFGGEEWIWTYVLLLVAAAVVFLGWGGRTLGLDAELARRHGESPRTILW